MRRNAEMEESDDVHYKVAAFGDNLHLHLERNRRFLAPNFKVEVLGTAGTVVKRHTVENCYYTGTVRGRIRSNVALSNCDGLVSISRVSCIALVLVPYRGVTEGTLSSLAK